MADTINGYDIDVAKQMLLILIMEFGSRAMYLHEMQRARRRHKLDAGAFYIGRENPFLTKHRSVEDESTYTINQRGLDLLNDKS